jgi:hypothetical protein
MNKFLDSLSDYLAHRKGLLPVIGIILVLLNLLIQGLLPDSWLAQTDLFLHLGVVIAILGFLLAWAL